MSEEPWSPSKARDELRRRLREARERRPPSRVEISVLTAAIEGRVPYADACDNDETFATFFGPL